MTQSARKGNDFFRECEKIAKFAVDKSSLYEHISVGSIMTHTLQEIYQSMEF
jgi:hypothetical protein